MYDSSVLYHIEPFAYQAGVGGVITGWDQGCLGMTEGDDDDNDNDNNTNN